jgi:MFS transporter, DHA1 family, multidrug resistance protein
LPPERCNREPLERAIVTYGVLMRQRRLIGYAAAGGFFYAGMFAHIAGTPFANSSYHHVPPQLYGLLFGTGIIGIMAANLINARMVMRLGSARLLRAGTVGAALGGALLAVNARTGWGGLAGLAVPLFLFIGMAGFIIANSIAGALASFPERAEAASQRRGVQVTCLAVLPHLTRRGHTRGNSRFWHDPEGGRSLLRGLKRIFE